MIFIKFVNIISFQDLSLKEIEKFLKHLATIQHSQYNQVWKNL